MLFSGFGSIAQDTVYYDYKFQITNEQSHSYYQVNYTSKKPFHSKMFYQNGDIYSVKTYNSKKLKEKDSESIYYFNNNLISRKGSYKKNRRHGEWKFYLKSGNLSGIVTFNKGTVIKSEYWNEDGSFLLDINLANQMPSFVGGEKALFDFLRSNLVYPENAKSNNIVGIVNVIFLLTEDGRVINVHIAKSINKELDQEALRVIKIMPDWNPGIQYNSPVEVWFKLPIKFKLQ